MQIRDGGQVNVCKSVLYLEEFVFYYLSFLFSGKNHYKNIIPVVIITFIRKT